MSYWLLAKEEIIDIIEKQKRTVLNFADAIARAEAKRIVEKLEEASGPPVDDERCIGEATWQCLKEEVNRE